MSDLLDRIQTLRQDHLSFTEIAARLSHECGRPVTRNSVAGVIHRAGLPKLPPRPKKLKRPAAPKRRRPSIRLADGGGFAAFLQTGAGSKKTPPPKKRNEDRNIPIAQRRTLLELTSATCRWPVGDPQEDGFFFCGGEAVGVRPYCRCHLQRASQEGGAL
jgi:GcrA cell cycle regulator